MGRVTSSVVLVLAAAVALSTAAVASSLPMKSFPRVAHAASRRPRPQHAKRGAQQGPSYKEWTIALNHSVYSSHDNVLSSAGYSALSGDNAQFFVTDVTGQLYAIATTTGIVQWTFSEWDDGASSTDVAQRQLQPIVDAHGRRYLLVLRGTKLFAFHASTGRLHFLLPLNASYFADAQGPSLSDLGSGFALLTSSIAVVVVDVPSASSSQLAPTKGEGNQDATLLTNVANGFMDGGKTPVLAFITVQDTNGFTQQTLTMYQANLQSRTFVSSWIYTYTQPSSWWAYLISCDETTGVMMFASDQWVHSYRTSDGVEKWKLFLTTLPQGYGFVEGSDTLFFHFLQHVAVFNFTAGTMLGNTAMFTNVTYIAHILAYPGATATGGEPYAVLGLQDADGSFNISAWARPAPSTGLMPLLWSIKPPSLVSPGSHQTLSIMEGNWFDQILVPLQNSFNLYRTTDGKRAMRPMPSDSLPEFAWKTFASLDRSFAVFGFGKTIASKRIA